MLEKTRSIMHFYCKISKTSLNDHPRIIIWYFKQLWTNKCFKILREIYLFLTFYIFFLPERINFSIIFPLKITPISNNQFAYVLIRSENKPPRLTSSLKPRRPLRAELTRESSTLEDTLLTFSLLTPRRERAPTPTPERRTLSRPPLLPLPLNEQTK